MRSWQHSAAVAAGHPATARAGIDALADGGTAADAAVAAALASCVAETVMTGIAGGGHAVWWDANACRAELLDCFVAVPGLGAERVPGPLVDIDIPFGEQPVTYAIGIASCGVPGLPAGLDELWRRYGRLPWRRLCEPAVALARSGVELPPAHAACLAMLEPVLTLREGRAIYAPGGRLLEAGGRLHQPGLVRTFEIIAEEGARSFYGGTIARELLLLMDEREGAVTADDLRAYEPRWLGPTGCSYAGVQIRTRAGLAGLVDALSRLPQLAGSEPAARALALVGALDGADRIGHTTNLTVVDADGNACVLTTSLGLGSGDFLPGLDVHLNSMLGESELLVAALEAGERMQSMTAPTVALDEDGLVLAAGSAGGSRLRSALVQVLAGILDERLDPVDAVERPRLHPAGREVHAEPGFPETVYDALEAEGYAVRRWPAQHHYFGGTSVVAWNGSAADPRRSGLVLTLGNET